MIDSPQVAIVVPCYYEEEVLPTTAKVLNDLLLDCIDKGEASQDSYVCYVNDGSQDKTWPIIEELSANNPRIKGINLSRNFGHQSALMAGLYTAEADVYISIDADLQDDEQKMHEMLIAYKEGHDIVYGVRNDRATDTWFKRSTAGLFYTLRGVLKVKTIPNHADYRLMSKRAVEELKQFGERNMFLRGVIPLIGFPATQVEYTRKAREAGESKYPLKKMIAFAWEGIVNFSAAPLYMIFWAGIMGFFLSIALVIFAIVQWYLGSTIQGWTSIVVLVSFFGSINFIFLGVLGLYIHKIFTETKQRPRFAIQQMILD